MLFIIIAVVALILIIIINTLNASGLAGREEYKPEPADPSAVERLAGAVRLATVSHYDKSKDDLNAHRQFQAYLTECFPLFHKVAERTVLSEYAVIYCWHGKNESLPPVLLTAHYDVVPADASKWSRPPFAAVSEDGYLWGRGTLDTKNTLMSSLEAAESLCRDGFQPERTVYFAFGGDEEITGSHGALKSMEWFQEQGINFEWMWDEGAITADGLMPGIRGKLSLIGTAEKGQVNVLLKAVSENGGHAAMPPKLTPTGRIARAVARIEAKPFRLRWLKTTRLFFKRMAAAGIPVYRVAMSNLWLTGGLLKLVLGGSPNTAALLRTTMAPTMIRGSHKENVLADEAEAVVNVRILPGDSVEGVLHRIKKVVADEKVSVGLISADDADEPVFESSIKAEGYQLLEQMLKETISDTIVLPYLATTASDSRHYAPVCRDIYRYAPMILNQEELDRIHGVDERISFENYGLSIRSYLCLMKKL